MATQPEIVVGGAIESPAPDEGERLLVAVDGSPASIAALRWALDEAARRPATLEVAICWEPPLAAEVSGYGMGYLTPDEMSFDARTTLEETFAAAHDEVDAFQQAGHVLVRRLLEGAPGPTLAAEAKGAAAVVVGRRGHGGFSRIVLGSVSAYVVKHADCPVVVVPEMTATGAEVSN